MHKMISEQVAARKKAGLVINEDKSKYTSNQNEGEIYVKEIEIEKVEEYIYLGQCITFVRKMEKEQKDYWSLRQVFKSKMIISFKVKILEFCVLPVLIHGAQIWILTKLQYKTL